MLLQTGNVSCKEAVSASNTKSKESFCSSGELSACTNSYFSDAASQLIPCAAPGKLMKLERRDLHKKHGEQNLLFISVRAKRQEISSSVLSRIGADVNLCLMGLDRSKPAALH